MKKRLLAIFTALTVACIGPAQAQNNGLPGISSSSTELKLDLDDAVKSIGGLTKSAEPLVKHLSEGSTKLSNMINEIKANPNLLNKSKFELEFAGQLHTMMEDIDGVLENRQEIQWAFKDVADEVRRVAFRLDHNYEKLKKKIAVEKFKFNGLRDEMKELARQIEREGDDATDEMKREFRAKLSEYRIMERTLRTQEKVANQLNRTLVSLGKNGSSVDSGGKNLDVWFSNLQKQRDAYGDLAEAHRDMISLTNMMNAGGANSLVQGFEKLREVTGVLKQFGSTIDLLGDNLDTIQTFNADDFSIDDPNVIADESEPWKEFL